MKFLLASIVSLSFCLAALQPVQSEEPAKKPIRVLIVDDLSPDYYHMLTATTIRNILREDKQFSVVLTEDAEILGTDVPFDYDVIFLHFKNYGVPKRDAAMKANLEKFVTEG
ncbi:MAG: ThuA domain-containing protein, partial [Planctomycetaceae bacterium]|nr:ThuA domain-containing protein [Planctomycetaceae bacterium]